MSMFSVNAALPAIYGSAAVIYAHVNPVAAYAGFLPFQATATSPGRSLSEREILDALSF